MDLLISIRHLKMILRNPVKFYKKLTIPLQKICRCIIEKLIGKEEKKKL
ncbi:MAG: hypothetical protein ACJA2M_000168 [Polaribacter sp.]|jgi:hypothetical protein